MPKKKNRFRRGFVKEAEEYAEDFRFEMDRASHEPLSALDLADFLDIPVCGLSDHPAIAESDKAFFRGPGNSLFSAATLPQGTYRSIVHNDYQHPNRQNSNVMHEIAHILLGHPTKPPLLEDSCRNFDADAEKEANHLGFTLLVPKRAALYAHEQFATVEQAAKYYGVSVPLLRHRIQITDVRRWSENRARIGTR